MSWLPLMLAAEAHGGENALEAPTWLDFLHKVHGWPAWLPIQSVWSLVAILLLVTVCYLGTRKMQRVPRGLQNVLEMAVVSLENFAQDILGPHGKAFTPFLGTLFIFIAVMNLMGLVPGFAAPTSNLNVTLSMALVVFVVVQYHGLRQSGFRYFKHFVGEPVAAAPLMFPLHVISELVRPLTLALRLFGNVRGEDIAILSFITLATSLPVYFRWLPLQFPLMLLGVLTSLVQALIFTLLTAVYLALASEEHEH